ncbi:NCS1 allantoate transporter [Eremomyces bilateralis CBS 781.70]|uniref:NCS1 allantoate transporter n=1 Tax=Eremomyces bilateralis CBS 781.70 TaxID=1392243 RepID=A0A6G1G2Z1_9PEZI|nr:NCS1 allantoate transporter [Eremomyces bilateralis CBS 781.70]KAF1812413.1 NCS1 allantoate transporter [Eremomyces bilateralis CBS 781.70]
MKLQFKRPHLKVSPAKSAFSEGNPRWINRDLEPVRRHERKWTVLSFIVYWLSDGFNASAWQFASSIIAVGLTWRESLVIVAVAFFIISFVISLNGAVGVIHHAPFPVIARASWGFWGSYVPIISRAVLGVFWFSIMTMNGANSVRVMIGAIWPSFLTLPNHISEDQGIATNTMVSFLIFWLFQIPFLCMHPNTLRWLFLVKSILVPIAWIAILIWAFVSAKDMDMFDQTATVSGSAYAWGWLASLTSVIGNYATLSVNQADFSRYSRVSVKWQLLYVPLLPIVFTFTAFVGIAATSSGAAQYGELNWDPMDLISHWPSRAARFFVAASFALAALGVNISANSLSAANDLTALFPAYVNIRRGQLLCALLSWALVPWKILASAASFLNFMAAYAVFLGPIASIMACDFWIIHERKYDTLALYQPYSIYRYTYGINWRAIVSFFVGVAPNLPGFINSINPDVDVGVGIHPYQFGWLLGFFGTALVYILLGKVFPPQETFIDKAVLPDDVYDASGYMDEPTDGESNVLEGQTVPIDEENIVIEGEKGRKDRHRSEKIL